MQVSKAILSCLNSWNLGNRMNSPVDMLLYPLNNKAPSIDEALFLQIMKPKI